MTPPRLRAASLLAALVLATACAPAQGRPRQLEAFRDEAQLAHTLDAWRASMLREQARRRVRQEAAPTVQAGAPLPAPAASPAMTSAPAALDRVEVTGSRIGGTEESITNNQVQGVDEGDIVKRRGDFLIVLRRGRLFTLRIGGDQLRPVAMSDAFGPDVDASGTWIDEMLVSGDTVAVIGYSYARGGTEVALFDLDPRGRLAYRATWQLRSHDYYSARNYASRLVGGRLVFYSPMHLSAYAPWQAALPAYRRWRGAGTPPGFRRMLPATRIYRGIDELAPHASLTLHTVSVCDLAARELDCRATAVLGPSGRVFHVAQDAVYVWTTDAGASSSLFRLPLDGGAPAQLRTTGSPVDQMGFLQRDGHLNVVLQREGRGEGMWASNATGGELALLRVPLSAFGGLDARATRRHYRALPGDGGWGLRNRFVGDWLVYGNEGATARMGRRVHALRFADASPVQAFALAHALQRIEALGRDALLVGPDGADLLFTPLQLAGHARLQAPWVQRGAMQGDDRTHGFFYRTDAADAGVLGLPILRQDERGEGAGVLFLRQRALRLSPLGTLDARRTPRDDDGCRASCVDWYGNARPIFIGDRVFALLGYELVEGRVQGERIVERRRVDFTPAAAIAD
ncbi:MAG: beta-propeller domain-containing protein [Pseudomonadota bacterium]